MEARNNNRSQWVQKLLMGNKAFMICLGLCIIMAFASPVFMRTSNLLNVLRQVCVSTLLSIGFTVVLASGQIDLSVGNMLGLCGMVLAKLIKDVSLPLPVAILFTLMLAMICGALNAALITVFRVVPFIVTLATQSIFKGATYLISNLVPVAGLPDSLLTLGQGYWLGIPVPVYIMLVIVVMAWIMVNRTKFGRYVLAMGGNSEAARVSGMPSSRWHAPSASGSARRRTSSTNTSVNCSSPVPSRLRKNFLIGMPRRQTHWLRAVGR